MKNFKTSIWKFSYHKFEKFQAMNLKNFIPWYLKISNHDWKISHHEFKKFQTIDLKIFISWI